MSWYALNVLFLIADFAGEHQRQISALLHAKSRQIIFILFCVVHLKQKHFPLMLTL